MVYSRFHTLVYYGWWLVCIYLFLALAFASATYAQSPVSVAITAPTTQSSFTTNRNAIILRGSANSNAGIQTVKWWVRHLNSNASAEGLAKGTATWEVDNVWLFHGLNEIGVLATDFAGNKGFSTMQVTYQPDAAAPQIVVTAPVAGQAVAPGSFPKIAWYITGTPPYEWKRTNVVPDVAIALYRNGALVSELTGQATGITNTSVFPFNYPEGDGYQIVISSNEGPTLPSRYKGMSQVFRIGASSAPVISTFAAAAPNGEASANVTVKLGEDLNFRWKLDGFVNQLTLSNVGDVRGRDSKLIKTTQLGQFTYTLTAVNSLGTTMRQVTVNIVSNNVVNAAEVLHNGIALGSVWPPKPADYPDTTQLPPYLQSPPSVIPINTGRQLFVDDFLIESGNLTRQFHPATLHPGNPVLKPASVVEKSGEGPMAMPFSNGAFYDPADRLFKLWYMCGYRVNLCYATSTDGVNWNKPALDVVPGTNVVFKDTKYVDAYTNWIDLEDPNPARRFKMLRTVYTEPDPLEFHLHYSADGIHWGPAVVVNKTLTHDRQSFFRNPFRKKWGLLVKDILPGVIRTRRYAEHDDLSFALNSIVPNNPSSAEKLYADTSKWMKADALDTAHPDDPTFTPNLYSMEAAAYESLMLAQFSILRGNGNRPSGRPKLNEIYFGFSRDGFHWHRPNRQPMIGVSATPGSWNWGNVQPVAGGPLVVGDQMYFYFSARGGVMADGSNTNDSNGATGLATMRRDGFASLNASTTEGSMTTRRVNFDGRFLFVNAELASGGRLCAEVLDENNQPLAPFTKANCQPFTGNSTKQMLGWTGGNDLGALMGRTVKLRFYLTNGKLYSFWISPSMNGESRGFVGAGGPAFASYRDSGSGSTSTTRVSLTPATQTVTIGQTATLSYSISGAISASFNPALPNCVITLNGGIASGSCTVPTASAGTFNYTLTAQGVSATAQVVVTSQTDTTAPTVTLTNPTQNPLAAGTRKVTLSVTTNENAVCRFTNSSDVNFAAAQTFTTTGALAHSVDLATLDGQSYSYLVRCADAAGNASNTLPVNFSISNPVTGDSTNRALLFDGKTGAVLPSTTDGGLPLLNWSMEAWVNTSAQKGDFQTVLGNNSGNELRLTAGADAKALITVHNGVFTHFFGSKKINDGRWHHLVAVRNNDKLYLYVDGQADTDSETRQPYKSLGAPGVANGFNLRAIGKRGTNEEWYEGQVDEIRLLTRALSASEIAARYNNGQGLPLANESNLLMGFNFNEASGAAIDASPNNYRGTLSGGVTRVASTRVTTSTQPQITSFTVARNATGNTAVTPSATATIALGQTVTLAWSLLNAQSATISGTNCQSLALPQGSCQHTPTATGQFSYTLTALSGGKSVTSTVTVQVVTDTVAPAITVATAPSSTTSSVIRLTGQANDNTAVTAVRFASDRGAQGTATGTANWSADVPLQAGVNAITLTALDAAGNRGTATVRVTYNPPTVDNTAPIVTLAIPSTDTFPLGTRLIAIEVRTNENAACRIATDAATAFSSMTPFAQTGGVAHALTLPTADGQTYMRTIRCSDAANNISAARTLTIRVTPPVSALQAESAAAGAHREASNQP
jgi:hypothetical protein